MTDAARTWIETSPYANALGVEIVEGMRAVRLLDDFDVFSRCPRVIEGEIASLAAPDQDATAGAENTMAFVTQNTEQGES